MTIHTVLVSNSGKKQIFPQTGRDGQIEKGREDVGSHQGADTLTVFVRKSSRESGGISMSSFLSRNKAQESQICVGDKYPTIGVVLTVISMCISSMCPTTACSVVKNIDNNLNEQLIDSDGFKSIWRHLHAFSREQVRCSPSSS
jgi:hypothetical protein